MKMLLNIIIVLSLATEARTEPLRSDEESSFARSLSERCPLSVGLGKDGHLNSLRLTEMELTGNDLLTITRLMHLETLMLNGSRIGDEEARAIMSSKDLIALNWLALEETDVSDEALEAIGYMGSLRRLDLSGTGITDKGMEYLRQAPESLRVLRVFGTKVTAGGIQQLTNRLSKLEVYGLSPQEKESDIADVQALAEAGKILSLSIGKTHLRFQLTQDGRPLQPVEKNSFHLKPKEFTLDLRGDVSEVSVMATRKKDFFAGFQTSSVPVVIFDGTSQGWSGTLLLTDSELEWVKTDKKFFHEQWGCSETTAEHVANYLTKKVGKTPVAMTSCRYYLSSAGKDLRRRDRHATHYIATIEEKSIRAGEQMQLVVILGSPLGQGFREICWICLDLEFK